MEYEPKFGSFRTTCRVRVGRNNDVDVEHSGNLGRWLTRRERASCRCVSLAAFCKPPLVLSLSLSLSSFFTVVSRSLFSVPLFSSSSAESLLFSLRVRQTTRNVARFEERRPPNTHTHQKKPRTVAFGDRWTSSSRSIDPLIPFGSFDAEKKRTLSLSRLESLEAAAHLPCQGHCRFLSALIASHWFLPGFITISWFSKSFNEAPLSGYGCYGLNGVFVYFYCFFGFLLRFYRAFHSGFN